MINDKEYEAEFEKEFQVKVEEIAYYQGGNKRLTLDKEWTEEDLKDDIWDEADKILNGRNGSKSWIETHKGRALKDEALLHPEFIVNDICDRYDIIEAYNRIVDKHRNDEVKKFGIALFDEVIREEINKILKNNLVTG